MTANQIAARSVDEEIRHNQAVEDETGRHNHRMEELQERQLNITENYQNDKNALEKEYNTLYLEYLNAAEQDKVELESRLNDIKEAQVQNEKVYKDQLNILEQERNAITASYNQGMLEKYGIDQEIENRKIDYEKQIAENNLALKYEELELQRDLYEQRVWKEQQDLFMQARELSNAEWSLNLRSQELDLASQQFQFEQQKWDDQADIREYQAKSLKSQSVLNTSRTIDLFNPFKTSNQAAGLITTGIQLLF